MPSFENTRRVHHSAENMFDLVADVEKYPHFVPLCENLIVRRREQRTDGRSVLIADMTAAYGLIRETFTSKVTLDRENLAILVEYLDGPFRYLENRWNFHPLGERQCEVRFWIAYDFKSRMLAALVGAMFERAFRKFSAAFEARADKIYKKP